MKMKECLACQMDQQRVAEFITAVSIGAENQGSYRHAWREYWETAEDDQDAEYPTAFLTHLHETHEEEIRGLADKIIPLYNTVVNKAYKAGEKLVKEVF